MLTFLIILFCFESSNFGGWMWEVGCTQLCSGLAIVSIIGYSWCWWGHNTGCLVWFKLGFAACKASALTFVLSLQPPECHSLKLRFWLFCSVSESNLQVTCYTIDFPCLNISYRQWVITGRSFALQKWIFKSHWSNKGMLCFLQVLALQLIYSLEYFLYLLPWRLWYIDHCKPPRILDHFEVPVIFSLTPSS